MMGIPGKFFVLALLLAGCTAAPLRETAPFSFGLIADCQYADADAGKTRHYRCSLEKLSSCVETFNGLDLEFVVSLGDLIDRDMESYARVLPLLEKLKAKPRFVLGNHEFSVEEEEKPKVPDRLGMPSPYYAFRVRGWCFLVLDGNDLSLCAHPKGSERDRDSRSYHGKFDRKPPGYNGAIGEEQKAWMEKEIVAAARAGERVVFFCHFPVQPDDSHSLWNAKEIRSMIEKHDCVVAWINGHDHRGGCLRHGKVHYWTVKGMVETAEENAFAVVTVRRDRLEIRGFGREPDRVLDVTVPAGR